MFFISGLAEQVFPLTTIYLLNGEHRGKYNRYSKRKGPAPMEKTKIYF